MKTCSRSRFGMCYRRNLSDTDCPLCKHHSSFLSRSFNYNLVNYGHGQRSRSDSAVGFRATSSIDTICPPKASTILLEDKSRARQSHSLSRPQVQSAFARVRRIYIIWLSNRTEHRIENNGWRLVDLVQNSSSFSRHVNLVTYPPSSYISFA